MPFGKTHKIILEIARWAINSFFDEIEVIGEENVPRTGPVIVSSTHHNMIVDPAVLSMTFPHGRLLHYWAKSTLFGHPVAKYVLMNAGNIPVDRKQRDNQVLFRGTFEALAVGEVVAIFPEGTSYTEPRIMQVKDGVSWTALEYFKWLQGPEGQKVPPQEDLVIVPASIVYTDKSRYRSSVVVEYGKPIKVAEYARQFLSGDESVAKRAVKSLTRDIGTSLVQTTINAKNWDTLYAAKMALRILWQDEKSIRLEDWIDVYQTLVDLLNPPSPSPNLESVKEDLLTYYSLLESSKLTNSSLSQLPLPRSLDPNVSAPLSLRISTLWVLIKDSIASILRLPFFLIPLLAHLPAYAMGKFGASLAEDEEETQAQNKIVFGLLALVLIYSLIFIFLWALLKMSYVGFLISALTIWAFAVYHVRMIDDNYEHGKRVLAAWRILIGVWGPRKWDLSLTALKAYTKVEPPPPNPWLDQYKEKKPPAAGDSGSDPSQPPAPKKAKVVLGPAPKRRKRPSSRHLIRHVLRARLKAIQSLASFLGDVERSNGRVRASVHLAERFNSASDFSPLAEEDSKDDGTFLAVDGPKGWRHGNEVLAYLRSKGARIGPPPTEESEWVAEGLSSGDEGEGEDDAARHSEDGVTWVAAGQSS
ncbi:uncharacterized protein EI90DRAFT_2999108 [Cantharellus anzutake]|uniref:uncharacterized protein n=1 Tax=Cantharellus anzutake TaxID=1750568 RepID=UPI0019051464|nr:uncharacterized protein EI90DRAFT_2999108 [Cantharellus anzutake]KAF8326546.1 hypothetical protein EI90DRAFT_2999108 [Cantharellus anzutake]